MKSAIVRIFAAAPAAGGKASVGVGFLVDDHHLLTCAHVVYDALAPAKGAPLPEGAVLPVDLPLLPAPRGVTGVLTASVEELIPRQPSGAGDVAVLRLDMPVQGAWPVRLAETDGYWNHRAGAFGLPAGRAAGVWHRGLLMGPQASGWIQMNLDPASGGYPVSRGFSGAPVWDETLGTVVGMMVVAEAGPPPVSYLIPTTGLAAAWPRLRELILPPSPFRPLKPFEESDQAIFHGRKDDSERVARAVGEKRTTTLIGPSGCGKSSLVRAGVIPRRRAAGDVPLLLRPTRGGSPLHVLAAGLVPLLEPEISELDRPHKTDRLVSYLARDGLHEVVRRVLELHHGKRLLVVIDQFEGLLDLPDDAVREFADALAGQLPPADVATLATLRADFIEQVQADQRLRSLVSTTFDSLLPMSGAQLHAAIVKPVEQIPGVRFEDGLVEQILADTGSDPRVLPLLAFTLDRLWGGQHGGALTFQAYHALGGVPGALAAYAGQAWAGVEDEDKPAARRLLGRLVRLPIGAEEATRRIVPRADLGDAEWRVAQHLAGARLIVLNTAHDADPADPLARVDSIELSHEVLITAWPELAQVTDKKFLTWHETLRHDLARWRDAGATPERLPTSDALVEARKWLSSRSGDLTGSERDYLERGRRYQRSRVRRRRSLIGVLSALVLAAATIGAVSVHAQQDAARTAALVRSSRLAADSQALSASDPGLAAQLAVAAYRSSPTEAAATALYSALQSPLLDSVLATTKGTVERTAAQAKGPLAAAVDLSGAVRVWDLGDPAKPILASTIQTSGPTGIALAPRAPLLAAACRKRGLCLWNLTDRVRPVLEARLPTPTSGPFHISSMAISPDGTLLAAASERGYTLLWSIARPAHPTLLADLPDRSGDNSLFAAVTFTPRGSFLAESHEDGTTSLWSLSNPAAPARIATIHSGYQDITINPASTILAGANDGNLDLWNIGKPATPAPIQYSGPGTSPAIDLEALSISPDGRTLAFGGTDLYAGDSELCLLDLADFARDPTSATPACESTGFSTYTVAYTSSGALLTGGLDDTVRLWRASPALIANASVYSPDSTPVVSADGHYMIAAITDLEKTSEMGLWNLGAPGGPALESTIPLPSAAAAYAAFLDTNVVLTETQDGSIKIWNISDPRRPRQTASLGNVSPDVDSIDGMGPPNGLGSNENVLAVQGDDGVMHLWHISSTGTATQRGTFTDPASINAPASVLGGGNTAFMTTKTGIDWWNISDPAHPTKTSFSPLAGADQGEGVTSSTGVFAAASPPDMAGGGSTLTLYNLANGHVLSTATVSRHSGLVLALSEDGHLLAASGLAGNGLNLWNTTDAQAPTPSSSLITAFDLIGVTFGGDDKMMADWNAQTVQLWDIQDLGAPVLVGSFSPVTSTAGTTNDEQVTAAGFTQNGKLVISTESDGPSLVYVLDTDPQEAANQLCSFAANAITPQQWAQAAPGVPYQDPCSR
jgi:WD40 repeat protein